jgi:hypothetical protein
MDEGVGVEEERVRKMLPSELRKFRRIAGVRAGPKPVCLDISTLRI